MPRHNVKVEASPAKPRGDTSPENSDGRLAMKDWGSKENRVAVEIITRVILDNRAAFRAEPALQPWNWNGGDPIHQKLKQLLTKICKDYEVDYASVAATRSPRKRAAAPGKDSEDKKQNTSPKKPKVSPAKKAVKKDVVQSNLTDPNEDDATVADTNSVSEDTNFTPSPSPTPKKKVSGSSPVKKDTAMLTTPKKIKEEPVTPVKSVAQEEKITEDAQTPSPNPEDKMDVDVDVEGEAVEEPPIKQTRGRKKRVISDDYTPSRSVTPAPASGSGSDALVCSSPNRPKRGCAKQKNYNLALTYDGLDEYLKEKEGIEAESDEEGQISEGNEEEEEEAGDGDAGSEEEGDVNVVNEQEDK